MNHTVNEYLLEGCGRCSLGGTPQCKVHLWTNELSLLRKLVLDCGLSETCKWGVPCYTIEIDAKEHNVLIVAAFKEYCAISFFKGILLKDNLKLLHLPGKNSQSVKYFKFTNINEIIALESTIKTYILEAIEHEKNGEKVRFDKQPEPIPEEFERLLKANPAISKAFFALTPGRQRGYIIHFSEPKQSKTRLARIEKQIQKILEGKGFFDK